MEATPAMNKISSSLPKQFDMVRTPNPPAASTPSSPFFGGHTTTPTAPMNTILMGPATPQQQQALFAQHQQLQLQQQQQQQQQQQRQRTLSATATTNTPSPMVVMKPAGPQVPTPIQINPAPAKSTSQGMVMGSPLMQPQAAPQQRSVSMQQTPSSPSMQPVISLGGTARGSSLSHSAYQQQQLAIMHHQQQLAAAANRDSKTAPRPIVNTNGSNGSNARFGNTPTASPAASPLIRPAQPIVLSASPNIRSGPTGQGVTTIAPISLNAGSASSGSMSVLSVARQKSAPAGVVTLGAPGLATPPTGFGTTTLSAQQSSLQQGIPLLQPIGHHHPMAVASAGLNRMGQNQPNQKSLPFAAATATATAPQPRVSATSFVSKK